MTNNPNSSKISKRNYSKLDSLKMTPNMITRKILQKKFRKNPKKKSEK